MGTDRRAGSRAGAVMQGEGPISAQGEATARQVRAADPATSTWLSANAGSGKTRVLIDRVARMLMAGVAPQRILCLTYTKAAASEMQNRLFERLGKWAMLPEGELARELAALGVGGAIDEARLRAARRLFARAIETPGGLKIQTIHSFCAGLLRRFPLEARVAPQFAEMDDRSAKLLRDEIVEDMADGPLVGAVDGVARHFTDEDFAGLTAEIAKHRTGLDKPLTRAQALALFGLPDRFDTATLLGEVFLGSEAAQIAAVLPVLDRGRETDIRLAAKLRETDFDAPGLDDLRRLEDFCLFGKNTNAPFGAKIGALPTKDTRAALGALLDPLNALMLRIEAARPRRLALAAAEKTHALHRFAAAFLPEYAARKAARGWLDFDDLILKARELLTDPAVAAWVLFRLDGGIDHILVDEAQDTSPDQWAVIGLLAQEFTAGRGARDAARTVFVVGDKKQSIYSFQGADLRQFDAMRSEFGGRLEQAGTPLAELTLDHSFRSSPAILAVVDATFRDLAGVGGAVRHLPFKTALPGRVDLWPPLPAPQNPEEREWFDPAPVARESDPATILARHIASEIRRMIGAGVSIQTDNGPRSVTEGDVLILVQRRSALFAEIIRACKALGLAIAGADRLKLGAELAVKDLAALLSFLATPGDDLSLAAALRSPLLGWTEAQLYSLAQPRGDSTLWAALAAGDHPETLAMLHDLRDRADFLRPYDLIERILTRHAGRERLLARLGEEAEEGIDALLSQALDYEQADVPSLTGFLGWLDTDEVEVKRRPDSAGDRIRVMTVHGAKGLEAPVVILPDTGERRLSPKDDIYRDTGNLALWQTRADESPARIAALRADLLARQEEENLRLLYVAMTRAQSWLIICAAGHPGNKGESWYALAGAGLARAAADGEPQGLRLTAEAFCTGEGGRLAYGAWPAPAEMPARRVVTMAGLPVWAGRAPARAVPKPALPLSPSDLGGAKALPGDGAERDEEAARQRGHLLHLLLEHLPHWPPELQAARARDLLNVSHAKHLPPSLPPTDPGGEDEVAGLLEEARRVLAAPALAPLFAPGTLAEVGITAALGSGRMLGVIDRLVIGPDRVLAVDYKSNALIPATPDQVPPGILRQMGAYAEALAQIYPGRQIETAILWTRTAEFMPLPPDLVKAALRSASLP